jgi:gamma-butyrobetaine dioxygenase
MGPESAQRDDPAALIERLFSGSIADRRFGEPVAIGGHMRQSAALAEADHAEPSLVVAALLHDIAYVLGADETNETNEIDDSTIEVDHAEVGAAWLERWFPRSVVEPVRLHVEAKRYLALTALGYGASLSDESTRTLALQGGVMTAEDAERFEHHPHFDSAVRLRRWDERGKDPEITPPPIAHFRHLIESMLGGE